MWCLSEIALEGGMAEIHLMPIDLVILPRFDG